MSRTSHEANLPRREFTKRSLQSLLTFSLLDALYSHDAFANSVKPITAKWMHELNALARDVKEDKIKQTLWQKKTESLLAQIDLPDLLELVDFEALTKKIKYRERGETSLRFKFKEIDGIPTKLVFGRQIFGLKKGRSVVPHGHNNMATAFVILKGKMHGRHYDRIEDQKKHLIIKPTIDDTFGAGSFTTVSDYKDNIHWFKAESDVAFIFNFHVLGLKTGNGKRTGRVYVDPNGEKLKDGTIRAPRSTHKKVLELYG